MKNRRQKTNKKQQVAIVESLDTKIAKAVYAEKKISERIIWMQCSVIRVTPLIRIS